MKVTCPLCKKKLTYDKDNKYRPFCSKPCYDRDLISWHEGDYAVKGEPASAEDFMSERKKNKGEDF